MPPSRRTAPIPMNSEQYTTSRMPLFLFPLYFVQCFSTVFFSSMSFTFQAPITSATSIPTSIPPKNPTQSASSLSYSFHLFSPIFMSFHLSIRVVLMLLRFTLVFRLTLRYVHHLSEYPQYILKAGVLGRQMGLYPQQIALLLVHPTPCVPECVKGQCLEPTLCHVHVQEIDIPAPLGYGPCRFDYLARCPPVQPISELVELLEV